MLGKFDLCQAWTQPEVLGIAGAARAGAGPLQSVSYRGNTDSTSSSQLICSDQGSMKNSTCGTSPESMGWSLEPHAQC